MPPRTGIVLEAVRRSVMRMVMGRLFVPRMIMVMGAMPALVVVCMIVRATGVAVGMSVFVAVFVRMHMFVGVAVGFAVVIVRVLVRVFVFVRVFMFVLVVAFHGVSLLFGFSFPGWYHQWFCK